jgi:Flp pilus assembly protein TadD
MTFRSFPLGVKLASVSAAAIMLQACGTMQSTKSAAGIGDDKYRDAIDVYSNLDGEESMDPIAAAAFWGTRYNVDQSDPSVAIKFSQALRKISSTDEAMAVMQKASNLHPDNADVSLEYGKTLVESERAFEAVRHLENAVAMQPGNWTALSAYGVALDQIGEHEDARKKYDRALAMAPNAVSRPCARRPPPPAATPAFGKISHLSWPFPAKWPRRSAWRVPTCPRNSPTTISISSGS